MGSMTIGEGMTRVSIELFAGPLDGEVLRIYRRAIIPEFDVPWKDDTIHRYRMVGNWRSTKTRRFRAELIRPEPI